MAVHILCMDSPRERAVTDGCISQQTGNPLGQLLVPGPADHTFATDSWSFITGSRALALTYTMRPQDPHGDGTGLRFDTGEHGGDYPDNMPTVTDAQGRWAVYVPLRVNGKIVVPDSRAH
jgi:hypothetical protein